MIEKVKMGDFFRWHFSHENYILLLFCIRPLFTRSLKTVSKSSTKCKQLLHVNKNLIAKRREFICIFTREPICVKRENASQVIKDWLVFQKDFGDHFWYGNSMFKKFLKINDILNCVKIDCKTFKMRCDTRFWKMCVSSFL